MLLIEKYQIKIQNKSNLIIVQSSKEYSTTFEYS